MSDTSPHCPHGVDGGLYCAAGKCSVANATTLDLARAAVQPAAPGSVIATAATWARAELERRHVLAFGDDDGRVLVIRGPHLSDAAYIEVADGLGNAQRITLALSVVADVAACLGAVEIDRLRRVVDQLEEEVATMRARAELAEARTAVPRSAP